MKWFLSVLPIVVLVSVCSSLFANTFIVNQYTGGNRGGMFHFTFDFDGTTALSPDNLGGQPGCYASESGWGWNWGWDTIETPYGEYPQSADLTLGVDGALKLLDSDIDLHEVDPSLRGSYAEVAKSSHLTFDVREPDLMFLGWGGMVMARVRNNGVHGAGVGFGFSSSDYDRSAILGIENNAINLVGWDNGNPNGIVQYGPSVDIGDNSDYRVYALRWSVDFLNYGNEGWYQRGQYDIWVSNGSDWSDNPSDWTPVLSDWHPHLNSSAGGNNAIPDSNAAFLGVAGGLMIGSFGPGYGGYSRTAGGDLDFDWISMINNPTHPLIETYSLNPWEMNPGVPEPPCVLTLGAGLFGFAGFVRRKK